jgi:hypothetical protein
MRRIVIAATILAAACGGKRTIPATPEIKASVTQADLGMSSSTANTQATIGLQSIGAGVADAASTGTVSSIDMTGLPEPTVLATAAVSASPSTVRQGLRSPGAGATAASTSPVGCIRRDPGTGTPQLIAPGTDCTAADHLEIDYDNGDRASVTWTGSDTSFDLRIVVTAGAWTGTNLHYQGQADISSVTVQVDGAMKYSNSGSPVHVDADFQITYRISGSQTATGFAANMSVGGTATDHIALVRARQNWSLTVQSSTSGQTEQVTVDWNGSVGIDLLKADGVTTDHSVAFNLHLHATSDSAPGTVTVTYSAGGDIEWDGAVVGNVVTKDNQLYIEWTDGTEDTFDPSELFGSYGV